MKIIAEPAFSNKQFNPYNFLLYSNMQNLDVEVTEEFTLNSLKTADIWHVHWPEYFLSTNSILKSLYLLAVLIFKVCLIKLYGLKIIWTVHNIHPHENNHPLLKKAFYFLFPKFCDGFIFLSQTSADEPLEWLQKIPKEKIRIIQHGHYRDIYNYSKNKEEARSELGIPENKFVYLFFGQVRAYKNSLELAQEYAKLQEKDSMLYIIGSTGSNKTLKESLLEITDKTSNIIFIDKFLDDEELNNWLSASDLIVLPYKAITNSGSVLMGLSFNKHVLAPQLGSLKELKNIIASPSLELYDSNFSHHNLINARRNAEKMGEVEIDLSFLDWKLLADQTKSFYLRVLNTTHKRSNNILKRTFNRLSYPIKPYVMTLIVKVMWSFRFFKKGKKHNLDKPLVVSLTSYQERFNILDLTLKCLLLQSYKPDLVNLWLHEDDFKKVPKNIKKLEKYGLIIKSYEQDLRSFLKIIPALEESQDRYIITVDDDLYYPPSLVENLVKYSHKHPNQVIANRTHLITTDSLGNINSYNSWKWNQCNNANAAYNFLTGVGGVLYPPNIFYKDILDKDVFTDLTPHADDVWLYWMIRLNNKAILCINDNKCEIINWPDSQKIALWKSNVDNMKNDKQIQKLIERYGLPINLN